MSCAFWYTVYQAQLTRQSWHITRIKCIKSRASDTAWSHQNNNNNNKNDNYKTGSRIDM